MGGNNKRRLLVLYLYGSPEERVASLFAIGNNLSSQISGYSSENFPCFNIICVWSNINSISTLVFAKSRQTCSDKFWRDRHFLYPTLMNRPRTGGVPIFSRQTRSVSKKACPTNRTRHCISQSLALEDPGFRFSRDR